MQASPLARPPLVVTPAEWDSIAAAIELGADHPLDTLLVACRVVVVGRETSKTLSLGPRVR